LATLKIIFFNIYFLLVLNILFGIDTQNMTLPTFGLLLAKIFNRIRPSIFPTENCGESVQIGAGTIIDTHSKIGNYTYIGTRCNLTKVTVGRYCSIGNNVTIGPGHHNVHAVATSSLFYADAYKQLTEKDCVIADNVWIGVDAVILRGVRIGHGAIVGANAVVTKDVPDFSIVAGVPARVIKYRHSITEQRLILESEWWKYDLEDAKFALSKLDIVLQNITE